jgi:hypothetical protein
VIDHWRLSASGTGGAPLAEAMVTAGEINAAPDNANSVGPGVGDARG